MAELSAGERWEVPDPAGEGKLRLGDAVMPSLDGVDGVKPREAKEMLMKALAGG